MYDTAETVCSTGKDGAPLSVDAARLCAMAVVAPVRDEEILPVIEAAGRVLARPVAAASALPPFDNSAMDGYAVRRADLAGIGPWRLHVDDRVAAGDRRKTRVEPGCAVRIMTGAPMPCGADAVVMQENVDRHGDMICLETCPEAGRNIRRRGEDVDKGETTLSAGVVLTPSRLALSAGCGVAEVPVKRRLRVAILSTGDELVDPGRELAHGQIFNSNRMMLRAALADQWIELTDLGILPDDPTRIREAIRNAAATHDVILSSGGVSAGEEDHILDALRAEQAELDILKVAIRPGKPLTVGRVGTAMYFGLPGNPYAAAITFGEVARPAIRRLSGITEIPDTWIPAVADFDYSRRVGRREYIPVTWQERDQVGRPVLRQLGRGASASLAPLAHARGIAAIPADCTHVSKGHPLLVEPFRT